MYNKVVREEDRLNSAKDREQQQDAVSFATQRDESGGDTGRGGLRDEYASQSPQNRGKDRNCSNCGRSVHDKSNCW